MKNNYPRILIISEFFFGENTGGSILLKNLFKNYPREKIFIIHEDSTVSSAKNENIFSLKAQSNLNSLLKEIIPNRLYRILVKIKDLYIMNRRKDTNQVLIQRLKDFQPEVIYTILGNYNLMCLIKEIKLTLGVPLITHIMDNMLANFRNRESDEYKIFKFFIQNSTTRVAINKKMAEVYKDFFSYDFNVIHNGVDKKKILKVKSSNKIKVVTYIGSIFKNAQLSSLIEITKALEVINKKEDKVICNFYFPENQRRLNQCYFPKNKNIKIKTHNLSDKDYFKTISRSDLLILASNFDEKSINYYKYSWPAKMGTYLMSKIPIFIYGPKEIYFIDNAIKNGWAYVESSNSKEKLRISIEKIISDSYLRKKIIKNAIIKSKEFEIEKIQKKFINLINGTVFK
tara:strand:- start:5013 stop:6212 length:1200 start_codon:yes stop_codon:yes gene_type:complete